MLSDVEKANFEPHRTGAENLEIINSGLSRVRELAGKAVRMHHHMTRRTCSNGALTALQEQSIHTTLETTRTLFDGWRRRSRD